MPYPQDLAGKAIDINFTTGLRANAQNQSVLTGMSADMTVQVYDYRPSRPGTGGAPPIPAKFTNTNAPWNITFLWWVPGENTTCNLTRPVLTGPMSGCYLFRYNHNGAKVVHIGTDTVAKNSTQAKTNWKIFVNHTLKALGAGTVFGASPKNNAEDEQIRLHMQGVQNTKIFGLFLPTGTAYTLLLQQLPLANRFAVHDVRVMNLDPWATVKSRPVFMT